MIKIIEGDILNAEEDIIGHQCNAQGVMGSGLAKQIRDKYPNVYREYVAWCKSTNDPLTMLGDCLIVGTEKHFIANIFGQLDYGRNPNVTYTNYNALKKGFETLLMFADENDMSIALPYQIGCGLGNGRWNIVYKIIDEVFADYEVTLYKLGK